MIEIQDNGMGLVAEVIPRLFSPFEQGADVQLVRGSGGLGLGLSICKAVVEMHAGSIEAASAGVGRGSRFMVRLPIAACYANAGAEGDNGRRKESGEEPAAGTGASKPVHILLVEDHPDTARVMGKLLRTLGYTVTLAGTVAAALAAATELQQTGGLDLIISDLGLPDGRATI